MVLANQSGAFLNLSKSELVCIIRWFRNIIWNINLYIIRYGSLLRTWQGNLCIYYVYIIKHRTWCAMAISYNVSMMCVLILGVHYTKHANITPLTKTTAAQNEVTHSNHRVRGLYFLAVIFEGLYNMCVHVVWQKQCIWVKMCGGKPADRYSF